MKIPYVISKRGKLCKKDMLGIFPIRHDIEILPADEPRKLKLGWTVKEVIGTAVILKR